MKKSTSIWNKIGKLSEGDLSKTNEKVEILTRERKIKKLQVTQPEKKKTARAEKESLPEQWLPGGTIGQLSVDLYDAGDSLIIISTVAGVGRDNIDITVEPDLITIRGERKQEKEIDRKNYFYQECFWGKFSRTLVLPVPVNPEGVRANIKNGVLIIALPKTEEKKKSVEIA